MPETPLISIVDDDDALRRSLKNLLWSAGFRARDFSTAEGLLSSGQVHETDCLILDLRLPGISGLELQQQLASGNARVPIIFITAHGDETRRNQALAAGAVAFLHKPFHEEDLLNAIEAALKGS